jgi:hypothetical protein
MEPFRNIGKESSSQYPEDPTTRANPREMGDEIGMELEIKGFLTKVRDAVEKSNGQAIDPEQKSRFQSDGQELINRYGLDEKNLTDRNRELREYIDTALEFTQE